MRTLLHNKHAHRAFAITVFIKGIYGFLETIAGFFILFLNHSAISSFILYLTQGELIEDPKDKMLVHLYVGRRLEPVDRQLGLPRQRPARASSSGEVRLVQGMQPTDR